MPKTNSQKTETVIVNSNNNVEYQNPSELFKRNDCGLLTNAY